MPYSVCYRSLYAALLAVGLANTTGCLVTRVKWIEPDYVTTRIGYFGTGGESETIEQLYATALEQEKECLESCVDLFYEVALATSEHQSPGCSCRQCLLHKTALNKLIITGQQFGRLDPRSCLLIQRGGREECIPIKHRGFVWQPSDFHTLVPVGNYKTNGLRTLHRRKGVGIPLVVTSHRPSGSSFVAEKPTFAATLRMCQGWGNQECVQPAHSPAHSCRLELYDPLRIDQTFVHGEPKNIAKDLSAPLAFRLRNDPQTIFEDFINPRSANGKTQLRAIEPYQPGKIPVVFIHGLLSNSYTWVEMINELQAHPEFVKNFQIWVIEYPTGQPFLTSAAECREQLCMARHTFDPVRMDPQLSNMVLVGHSMGGLISKLQITSSRDQLWRSIANRPFHEVTIPCQVYDRMTKAFFFEPSPDVSRVVFLGTPHGGSGIANRSLGRLVSSLVREPDDLVRAHTQIIGYNPGVFSREFEYRIPTSIDLLEPKSKLLRAIDALPVRCGVRMHSVIGNRCCTLCNGKSDGVVPVHSAREYRAVSERLIKTRHTRLTKHPETVEELLAILQQHLLESCRSCVRPVGLPANVDAAPIHLSCR